ncbi:MAG: aminopeptidase [Deltaproteobacteria bacterium]|jgi:aspartyl aminopeptidase|nr:aminopeptidase [Deltaproteobacteria bacterium]
MALDPKKEKRPDGKNVEMVKDTDKDKNKTKSSKASENGEVPNIWEKATEGELQEIEVYAKRYLEFLTEAKTERKVLSYLLNLFQSKGYGDLAAGGRLAGGGYLSHHGKLLGLFLPGKASPAAGFNIIVAHGDSPRLDLKPKCVYEDGGFAMLKTNLYGGLKKFQWLVRPVALWGFAALKDGRTLDFTFGEDPAEPVLTITDILPHMDRKIQRDKRLPEAFPAEKLNILAGNVPMGNLEGKNRLKKALLRIFKDKWGLKEEDLLSSEIEVVPAGPAREVGLDASFIGSYGQDDRLSVFASAMALAEVRQPPRPILLIVFDREEIGSYGSTGAESNFIERLAGAAFVSQGLEPSWYSVLNALAQSQALSADVENGADPTFKEILDDLNSAKLALGPCLTRYTGGAAKYGASEAGAEYMAKVRSVFDGEKIVWQSSLIGKQEEGGGGTVALTLAAYGINIVDCGAPVLSMHSPFEISSKADVWMTHRAYKAFLEKA